MALPAAAARRFLGLIGILAVVFTPAMGGPEPAPGVPGTVLAGTLAPGDHEGLVQRAPSTDPDPAWTDRPELGRALVPLALAAALTALDRRRRSRPPNPPASAGTVLLRAPTRSPPLAAAVS